MPHIVTSQNAHDLLNLQHLAFVQPAIVAGYNCTWSGAGILLDWLGPDAEPGSLLYHDGLRVDDIVLLNDFIYTETCYKQLDPPFENVIPPFGLRLAVPYSMRLPINPGGRPEVDSSIQNLVAEPENWRWALRTALLWWLEGARNCFYELRAVMLRMGFEVVWRNRRNEVSTALSELDQYVRNHGGIVLPAVPILQHYLIVGRHVRNHAAHSGDLTNAWPQVCTAISNDCGQPQGPQNNVWSKWEDWDAAVAVIANSIPHAGSDTAVFHAVELLQFILYGVLLRLLGLPLAGIEFAPDPTPDDIPSSWQRVAQYMQTLTAAPVP